MKCPLCQKTLLVVERHGIELDYCHKQHGIWFDDSELNLYLLDLDLTLPRLDQFAEADNRQTKTKKKKCPRCQKAMIAFYANPHQTLILDRCPKGHGIWFDHGELETLLDILEAERQDPDPASPVFSLIGETFAHSAQTPAPILI